MPDICANCTLLAKEPCFLIYIELKSVDVVSELERKNAASANRRKNQPRFRREVLGEEPRCIITNERVNRSSGNRLAFIRFQRSFS